MGDFSTAILKGLEAHSINSEQARAIAETLAVLRDSIRKLSGEQVDLVREPRRVEVAADHLGYARAAMLGAAPGAVVPVSREQLTLKAAAHGAHVLAMLETTGGGFPVTVFSVVGDEVCYDRDAFDVAIQRVLEHAETGSFLAKFVAMPKAG
jgi:hypothetical protein